MSQQAALTPEQMEVMRRGWWVSQPVAPQWRPISEAPKDETYVLGTNGGKIPFVMAWDVTDELWVTFNQYYERSAMPEIKAFIPTHWMPVPAPPGKEAP